MTSTSTFGERVRARREDLKLSQDQLAKKVGISQVSIKKIEAGGRTRFGRKLADALETTLTWLETGESPSAEDTRRQLLSATDQILVWDHPDDLPEDGNRAWIDRYDLVCSAGNGAVQWDIRQKRALPFTLDFFRAIGSDPRDCRLAEARGDSMEPFLFDRDMIMIDTSKTQPKDGKVFAVCFEDEFLVKQIFRQSGGDLTLHSYNSKYPDRIVSHSGRGHFEILGQIVYRSGSGIGG